MNDLRPWCLAAQGHPFPAYFFGLLPCFLGRPPSFPSSRILFRPYFLRVLSPPRRPASATVIAFFLMVAEYKSERLFWQVIFAFYSLSASTPHRAFHKPLGQAGDLSGFR